MPLTTHEVVNHLTRAWMDFPRDPTARKRFEALILWLVRRWRLDA